MDDSANSLRTLFEGLADPRLAEIGPLAIGALLAISALASFYLSFLYARFSRGYRRGGEIHHSFPLLGIAVTAIFITVQFSLPLSLGLLGALSIVRFRTPVKEPEDIGFVLLVIANGLACATFSLGFLVVLLGVSTLALLASTPIRSILRLTGNSGILLLDLSTADFDRQGDAIDSFLQGIARKAELDSLRRLENETSLTYRLAGMPRTTVPAMERGLRDLVPAIRADFVYSDSDR